MMAATDWNPDLYADKHRFVWEYGTHLVDLLNPRQGERILDVGCGTGQLTQQIADAGAEVIGIDNAPAMIAAARQNFPTITFEPADATDFTFAQPFDAVFSNAALHWVARPAAAAASIARALKPGGRFVAEFGGHGNIAPVVEAIVRASKVVRGQAVAHGWYFPTIGEYAALLEQHAFEVRQAALFDRPTPLADGAAGLQNWISMFAAGMLAPLPAEARAEVVEMVDADLRPTLFAAGTWSVPYRRLRIVAYKR